MKSIPRMYVEKAQDETGLCRIAAKWHRTHGSKAKVFVWPQKLKVYVCFDGKPVFLPNGPSVVNQAVIPAGEYLSRMGVE